MAGMAAVGLQVQADRNLLQVLGFMAAVTLFSTGALLLADEPNEQVAQYPFANVH
jgi:hypothetical protein